MNYMEILFSWKAGFITDGQFELLMFGKAKQSVINGVTFTLEAKSKLIIRYELSVIQSKNLN